MATWMRRGGAALGLLGVMVLLAAEPIESGLKAGQRPGPYTSIVSVGPQRGQLHCFICEAEDRPVVIVFSRSLSDPLGKLLRGIDKAVETHKKAELRAWATFLNDDQQKFDPQVVAWSKQHNLRNVPLGVFDDPVGPPTYKLHRGADTTVLLSVKQKVVKSFGFKDAALTDEQVAAVLKGIDELVK
jgi:hypothetical protein